MVSDSLISVIIPCYNHAEYLGECLRGLLAQTFKNWEAIVVDDASSQGNVESVMLSFHDTRIRFVRHQCNLGLAAARNTGFRLAQAQLVLPLDADDMLAPAYLEKVGSVLFDHPDADCAFSDFQLFGERTDLWRNQVRDVAAMTLNQWIPGPGTLMRRSLWESLGGYCEASELRFGNEDWDFWLRAVAIGVRAIHVPEALYLYRWQKTSMAIRLRYYDFQTREFIYRRHRALFDRYGTGKVFLADGCFNSARAAWQRGERLRTAYLAAHAWWLSPRRMHVLRLVLKALMPSFLLSLARKIWEIIRILRDRKALIEAVSKPLYTSDIGRNIYWNLRAKDIDQKYGTLKLDYGVLKNILTSVAPNRVLDVGCGSGRLFPLYQALDIKEVVGQDIARVALELAEARYNYQNIRLLNMPITGLDFPDFYFDLAICSRVLQHIPPDAIELTIEKICRLGKFVYINELSDTDRVAPNHLSFKHDYVQLFEKYGFSVKDEGFINSEINTQQKWFLFAKSLKADQTTMLITLSSKCI